MRYRMLDKQHVIDLVNEKTIPVEYNVTGKGYPRDIPSLAYFAEGHTRNPWTRQINAFFALIDPDGKHVYGALGCQCIELMALSNPYVHGERDINHFLALYDKARELRKKSETDPSAKADLEALWSKAHDEMVKAHWCTTDVRRWSRSQV